MLGMLGMLGMLSLESAAATAQVNLKSYARLGAHPFVLISYFQEVSL